MPKQLGHPDGWARRAIGDVATVSFSSVDKKSVAGEVPVRLCNYMDVWKNHYIDADLPFMEATATPREIKQFTLVKHDVLLTKDSETKEDIADPAVVRTDRDDLVLGYHLALVRPDSKKAHGPFIAAQLALSQFRAQFVRVANGATRYGLGIDEVRNGTLLLPGVDEQKSIAEYLGAVDATIDATRGVIEQTRRLKTAVLQDLLTRGLPGRHSEFREVYRLGGIPKAWKVAPLRELAEIQQGIALGPHREAKHAPTPYLRVANAQMGHIDLAEIKCIETTESEREKYALRQDDVLMVEGHANIAELGRASLVTGGAIGMVFQNHLFRLRTHSDLLDPRFLTYWTNSDAGRQYFRIFGGTTSGLNTVGSGQIGALRFPTPEIREQRAIADLVESIDARSVRLESDLNQLVALKTALSQALLTGRVRVPANTVEAV